MRPGFPPGHACASTPPAKAASTSASTATNDFRIILSPCLAPLSIRLPWNDQTLDLVEDHGEDHTEDADHHDAHEHAVDLHQLPRRPDELADPGLGGDELGCDDHDEGNAE